MTMFDQQKSIESLRNVHVAQIFGAAFITQFCMGLESLFRINAATSIKAEFFDVVDPLTSGVHIGEILGVTFLGFAIANFVMAAFVDAIGMRRLHTLSLITYLVGTAVICIARPGGSVAYWLLWGGSLLQGLSWGSIESVLNPLVVSLYPTSKVAKLNLFHAAYALGMLSAAPICVFIAHYSLGWQVQLALVFIPAGFALLLIARLSYPPSERVVHGVSFGNMFQRTLTSPLFYLCLCAMFLTTASELVPSSWMDLTLTKVAGIQGFWLVAFIYSMHVVVRLFAGWLNRHLGSAGILMLASVFVLAGLLVLSHAHNPVLGILGAMLFGMGTAVMWPTALAAASERFPAGGSFAIGAIASAGMLSTYVLMPIFGALFDRARINAAGGATAFKALSEGSPAYDQAMIAAATSIFQCAAVMPVLTFVFFSALRWHDVRRRSRHAVVDSAVAMTE
ncbi:MFS transporter [Paraburkholderia tropica]|uniref:MFS transporter n=1 Tax=Paraburkholderia tropica TaxID=92647 RepID=UPI0015919A44|nr:MFS transporter [Paraburkholderia tropica]